MTETKMATGSLTARAYGRLYHYLIPYKRRLLVGVLAGLLSGGSLFGLLQISPDLVRPFEGPVETETSPATKSSAKMTSVERVLDRYDIPAVDEEGRITWQFMMLSLAALPILVLLRELAIYLNHYHMRWIGSRVVCDLRNDLFRGLQRQSLRFFGKSDVGELISKTMNDASVVENMISMSISDVSAAPIEILVALGFVVKFAVEEGIFGLVAVMLLIFPLCIVPIVILGRYVKRFTRTALERISELVSRMHENFTGIRVVKAFDMEKEESLRFEAMNERYFYSVVKALRGELLMTPLMSGVGLLLGCIFFIICYAKGIRFSQIVPIGFAAIVVYRPTKQLARINANIQRGAAALERMFLILDTDTSLREDPDPVKVEAFRDKIVFEDVSFSYEAEGNKAVQGVSVEIPRGSVIALVGETGSGKTTMANLLARFYDPTGGRILLDGVDLRRLDISCLRRLIGVVTQETILFNDTIASNIAYGTKNATQAQIEAAARQANAHDFIIADPAGYSRMVGEKGFVLSGGERQRIAIARAILKDPPILILDEATSALDTVTERLVQEAIARVMKDRTVFAIAHRLSTVKHANQILLLDGGRVLERGSHDALFTAGGYYRKLCDMQVLDNV